MIVSWNWLKDYVALDVPVAELERRLMMAGLNHESTKPVGDDLAIDLEVTSNRPDCLGHLGIAREAAVLFGQPLRLPPADPRQGAAQAAELARVRLECPELCYRYTARVVRGVKIAPSPAWLVKRLATIGIPAINNVVDVTNYVLMECGQPLHAFDLARLAGREIVVREARAGETFLAIDHKTYTLAARMCVIADRDRPVALGGVMGGADTEVSHTTRDVLLECAEFDPLSIRTTARALNLHSASSYRFERGLDPQGVDWASRRACQLILELAGGELAAGVIDVGRAAPQRPPITLRLSQLPRILGIDIDAGRVRDILVALGNRLVRADKNQIEVVPPGWRRDLSREIDLVEEVARIHGYDEIPEDVSVPMATSARSPQDRVLSRIRHVLTAAGYDEALTLSAVEEDWSAAFSPWTSAEPLVSPTPILRRCDRMRRSLAPSLLGARRTNETLSNPLIELFEIARVYLPRPGSLPDEPLMLALTSGGDFYAVKGTLEALLADLNPALELGVRDATLDLLAEGRSCELVLDGEVFGYLGEVSAGGLKRFDLRGPATVAEIKLAGLVERADLVPLYREPPAFPATARDINLEMAEGVRWAEIAAEVRTSGGEHLEGLEFKEIYRNDELRRGGMKRVLFAITLRSRQGTLTSPQADAIRDQIVASCRARFGAALVA
ncbi:MAG: phenylalanine--tRNA ligase subunit beta [Pirellulales bacterium]